MTHRAGPVPITVNETGPGTMLPLTGDQVAGLLRVPGLVRPHPGIGADANPDVVRVRDTLRHAALTW
ncbi:hypothetical protein ABZ478_22615 [Streptomyces sp. NPDC005706]|uniref:hypothetical protein n=1 Tax=Streptomyces sp. NPDC005706 TaxID=3157169 RepID=UPI0033C7AD6C